MKARILVLGAGFGGLELSTLLSESLGESVEVTLIDKNDHFMFGFSKLDLMFAHAEAHATQMPYANFAKPGVHLVQQTITKIDPTKKRVTTDAGTYVADYLVVAWARSTIGTPRRDLPMCTNSIRRQGPKYCATCCPISRAAMG